MPQQIDKKRIGDTIVFMLQEEGPCVGSNMTDVRDQLGLSHVGSRKFRSIVWHLAHDAGRIRVIHPSIEGRSMTEDRTITLTVA
jgi:hypothetical protein